jgi:hypothetical protein
MSNVSGLAARFQRLGASRVVITGHGSYRTADAKIPVPPGKKLFFYCPHGTPLSNAVGMAVEGFQADSPPAPHEVFNAGDLVPNYILTYPSDLTLNGTKQNAKYDWVTVSHKGQAVPLSVLFKDSRCQRASEIHWAACRSLADWLAPDTHSAGYKIGGVTFAG